MSEYSADVIILTALPVEYNAIIAHLEEIIRPKDTLYDVGKFYAENQEWQVAVIETSMGSVNAALKTPRSPNISY